MTAQLLLENLQKQGIRLALAANAIKVQGTSAPMSLELRTELKTNKEAIILELHWRENFDRISYMVGWLNQYDTEMLDELKEEVSERAGIMEFEGMLDREEAESQAEISILLEWLKELQHVRKEAA